MKSSVEAPLSPMVEPGSYSLLPVLLPLVQAKWFLMFAPVVISLIVLVINVKALPIFAASTRILPPQYNQNTVSRNLTTLGGESALGNSALNLKNPTDLFVGILRSRTIIDGVIKKHDLINHYGSKRLDDARLLLEKRTDISTGKDGIVEIKVEDPSPQMAATLANAYVLQLQTFSQDLALRESKRRQEFFNNALDRARESLRRADEQLRDSEKRTGFTRLKGTDEAILTESKNLKSEINSKEVQLSTLLSYATESNPDVVLLRSEIANLKRKLQEVTGSSQNKPQGEGTSVSPAQAPDVLMDHSQRRRDVQYWEGIVNILGQYTELGKMDETRDFSLFQVLDVAIPPEKKAKPRVTVNVILSWLGSSMLCVLLVLLRAYIRKRRRDSDAFTAQIAILKAELFKLPFGLNKRFSKKHNKKIPPPPQPLHPSHPSHPVSSFSPSASFSSKQNV